MVGIEWWEWAHFVVEFKEILPDMSQNPENGGVIGR